MIDLQIVIPSINLWTKYTKRCIESVIKSSEYSGISYRILLIDNASTDETLEEAGKLVSDKFSHYRSPVRLSFSESVNLGMKDAFEERGAKYCLVPNNDTILREDTIKNLIARFNDHSEDKDSKMDGLMDSNLVMVTAMNVRGECKPEELELQPEKTCEESEHPDFSCFMVNRDCYEKVGPFDEMFRPAYFEDNDYHWRIKLLGLKAICYPKALYYHFGSSTTNEVPGAVQSSQFMANHDYFVKKWGGETSNPVYKTPFNK